MLEPALLQLEAPGTLLRWPVLVAAGALLAILVGFRARTDLLEAMGLDRADVALLTVGSVAAPALSVPVGVLGDTLLAVNLGGAIVPVLVAIRLRAADRVPLARTAIGIALVAAVTRAIVRVDPGAGVVADAPEFLAPGAVALAAALLLTGGDPARAGPVAFVAGSLGALVGADLLTLPAILAAVEAAAPGSSLVLGGAGAFDLIFLSGAIGLAGAILVALVATPTPEPHVGDPRAPARRVPNPDAVLRDAQRLEGLTPRERCLVELARANQALERSSTPDAVRHAHRAADALLDAGSPRLLDRVAERAPEPVLDRVRELNRRRRSLDASTPDWVEAADTVELAKSLTGALWHEAPGRVRLREVAR